MTEEQLQKLIKELKISRDQILREEAEMIILKELSQNKISAKILFYGGTALRLAYNSPRFSEDIDLLSIKKIGFSEFKNFIKKLLKKNPDWKLKDIKDKKQTLFTLLLVKSPLLKHGFSVKIELHKPKRKIKLEYELMLIKSPASIYDPLLLVPKLPQLKTLKEEAILRRDKARDIFDLWYISQALRENFIIPKKIKKYNEREFKNELQVYLPPKYYPIIKQLYGKINSKN